MDINETSEEFAAALRAQSGVLIGKIRQLLEDRPFTLNAGVSKEAVDAIHFEYEWESFQPIAIPLNTCSGYCGHGFPLELSATLIPSTVESALTDAMDADEDDFCDDLREKMKDAYVAWFKAAWHASRGTTPSMRGFLSVHDTIWRIDLDTGEEFREDAGAVKFF